MYVDIRVIHDMTDDEIKSFIAQLPAVIDMNLSQRLALRIAYEELVRRGVR